MVSRLRRTPADPIVAIGRAFALNAATICLFPIPLLLAVATTRVWQQRFWAGGFTLRWLLVAGHVLYALPFFVGALVPALSQPELREREAVAATLGAGQLRRITAVTLPAVRPALLAAAIIVVTLSLGEFNVSFFLFAPTAKTLPVDLYAAYITGRIEVAAAATVWFLVLVVPAALVIERLGGARIGQV